MKEKILEALKTKFEGVKDEILGRMAEKAAKTVKTDADIETYIEGVTMQTLLEAYGDSRATDAQKTAVANYERKHNIKDGKPVEEPKPIEPKPKGEETVPAWAQAIIDSNKAMQEELAAIKGEKVATTRKAQLDEILKDAPEKIRARFEKDFERLAFKDDDDFGSWLADSKTDIESITADFTAKGGVITPPKQSGGEGKTVNPLVQARIDARAKETVQSAIQG